MTDDKNEPLPDIQLELGGMKADISDTDDIVNEPIQTTDEVETEEEEDDLAASEITPTTDDNFSDVVEFDKDQLDLRGEKIEKLIDLIAETENDIGPIALDARVRTVGSWENIVYRAISEISYEENRIQNAIANLKAKDNGGMSHILRNEENKVLLRTSSIVHSTTPGEITSVTGAAAKLAFECQESGGGYKIPLYNSGITIDVVVPTGNDIQTLLTNCMAIDRELGTSSGAHYFTYADVLYKHLIIEFLQPLIIGSSYTDWRKQGKLWSIIKLPDFNSILMHLAALCYRDGYDNFATTCTSKKTEANPTPCRHVEKITANLFEMILTRFPVMSKDSIEYMVDTRRPNPKHTLQQIAKYQAGLGLEGETIEFGNIKFTMTIPSMSEYIEAGKQFIADIINEIEGDNTAGQYEQLGFRYIRTFVPWIASVEKKSKKGGIVKTNDYEIITRELEKLSTSDTDGAIHNRLREYIDKSQLTYVGYPVTPCPACGYEAETPSGLWTVDPFNTFFTLAFRSLTKA